MSLESKLIQYRDAGYPIIFVETYEEEKVDRVITKIAKTARISVIEWNGAVGVCDFAKKVRKGTKKMSLCEALEILQLDDLNRKMIVIKDMNDELSDPQTIAQLKRLALKITSGVECTVVMVSPVLTIPKSLEKFITVIEQEYIDDREIRRIINDFTAENELPPVAPDLIEQLAVALKGLTEMEVNQILALAVSTNGDITKKDLQFIFEQKQQMIMKSGILEMIPLKEKIDDIGGLENLKEWLKRKSKVFNNINKAEEFGVNMPKGLLIAGVPGCGKSLSAKAAASLFEVPLLRLDMGRLMGKYVGESESNMRQAIRLAEAIAPCVLWIDELEKAFEASEVKTETKSLHVFSAHSSHGCRKRQVLRSYLQRLMILQKCRRSFCERDVLTRYSSLIFQILQREERYLKFTSKSADRRILRT